MTDYVSLTDRLIDYIMESTAPFTLKDIYRILNIYTLCSNNTCTVLQENIAYKNRRLCPNCAVCVAKEQNLIRVQLHKLCEKGLVEKSRRIAECYRRIDKELVKLDIARAEPGTSIDLRFPLQLEKFIRIMPKSLVIVAGATGAGKSAYLLNMALINVDRHPIHYFANSEMTANRIKERVLDYEFVGQVNMDNFNAYEREDNFQDCIFPDGINIVDYIEIPSERPSVIADYLQAINSKLNNGVVICAIQKKTSQRIFTKKGEEKIIDVDLGVGGEWSKRKATVYITMDSYPENKLVVRKVRERVERNIDPTGWEWNYKLVNGINFVHVKYPDAYSINKPNVTTSEVFR